MLTQILAPLGGKMKQGFQNGTADGLDLCHILIPQAHGTTKSYRVCHWTTMCAITSTKHCGVQVRLMRMAASRSWLVPQGS